MDFTNFTQKLKKKNTSSVHFTWHLVIYSYFIHRYISVFSDWNMEYIYVYWIRVYCKLASSCLCMPWNMFSLNTKHTKYSSNNNGKISRTGSVFIAAAVVAAVASVQLNQLHHSGMIAVWSTWRHSVFSPWVNDVMMVFYNRYESMKYFQRLLKANALSSLLHFAAIRPEKAHFKRISFKKKILKKKSRYFEYLSDDESICERADRRQCFTKMIRMNSVRLES